MFKPMRKIVKIGDTGVKLAIRQDVDGDLWVEFTENGGYVLMMKSGKDTVAALGFPTEPLEEEIEEIEGVIE